MKNKIIIKIVVFGLIFLFFGTSITAGINSNFLKESTGVQLKSNDNTGESIVSRFQDDVLLIPDWTNDRVLGFDPYDGSYIGEIIPDDGRLSSPKCAIPSSRGTIFVSDQIEDSVFEYDIDGNYITTIVNQASSGIDNIRGITVYNSYLYVTVFQGSYAETIQRFDLNGGSQTTWTSTQINSPFDIHLRSNDALVANANSDAIERYDHSGNWLGTFVGTGIEWPSQIYECDNGNLYVTGSFSPAGIYKYDQNGNQLNYYPIARTMRGVHELGNGLLLFTTDESVSSYNPTNAQIIDIYTNGNFQFIDLYSSGENQPPNEPSNPNPTNGETGVLLNQNLSWTGGDPNSGDTVTYDIYFGTTTPPPQVVSNQSATTYNPGIMNPNTKYYWKIVAWDNHGASTPGVIWDFTTKENTPPNTPTIDGPKSGKPGIECDYILNSIDSDGDVLRFIVDWDDGDNETTTFVFSGNDLTVSHTWNAKGTYIISVKAEDEYGAESNLTTLEVTIPRTRQLNIFEDLLERLFERFPNAFPILRQILRL